MLYNPRTVALVCELFHPPMQPDPAPIQRVHNTLFQGGQPPYSSFTVTPAGAVLSNPVSQPGASSFAAFLPDRFQFREELSSLTHDDFAARVKQVAREVSAARSMQVFTAQHVTLRTLVNPRFSKDSRRFIKHSVMGLDDETDVFGREPVLYGLRFVFPATPEHPGSHTLKVESFLNDPRSLFLENVSGYGPILVDGGLDQIEQNILASYRFVTEQTMRFIAGFDAPPSEPPDA